METDGSDPVTPEPAHEYSAMEKLWGYTGIFIGVVFIAGIVSMLLDLAF